MAGLLRRRRRLPEEIASRLGHADRERVLAWAPTESGWVAASERHLLTIPAEGEAVRRPWAEVAGASFEPERLRLAISWVSGEVTEVALAQDDVGTLTAAVRQRIEESIVLRERVEVARGRHVQVVLRRTADGRLMTQVLGRPDTDLTDPAIAERVDDVEARLREAAGL
jgi:hypothetical protein